MCASLLIAYAYFNYFLLVETYDAVSVSLINFIEGLFVVSFVYM